MNKLVFLISEGIKNLWRHKLSAFSSIFSIFLTLIITGSLLVVSKNTNKIIEYIRDKYKIEIFFNNNVTVSQAKEIINKIELINGVRSITLISQEDAKKIFKSQFGEDIFSILGYNPLPLSCVVNIVKNKSTKIDIRPIIANIKNYPEVGEVNHQGKLISRIEYYYDKFLEIASILFVVVLVVSIFIISNTVRLTVYSKKELITSLQLIGATKLFVKAPFVIEGIFHGLLGSAASSFLLILFLRLSSSVIFNISGFSIDYDEKNLIGVLTAVAISVSIIGSNRAISKFLK